MTQDMVKMMSQDKMIGKREILSSSPSPWSSRSLRMMLLLLMMTLGVGTTWGQEKDYSGMYYLANNNKKNNVYDYKGYNNSNNFYLRSADFYWNSDNDTPYLTTYQTGQDDVALWIVEKVENTDYYTFKQKDGEGYKYLTVNNAPTGSSNHRKRVHLETTTTVTDKNYFTIELITTQDGICGYSIGLGKDEYLNGTTNRYLNPAGGNMNSLSGGADRDGIIGFYTKGEIGSDSSGSIWFFEVPKPVIHIDGNNKLTFSCKNEDVTYYYTIDGDDPIATDANTYDESADNILSEGVHTIKVIAVMNSGNTGYASGVVTREVTIFSTEHPYLISNNQSAWTVGNETKNVFYMIPSDNNTVNTTSMPRPTMEWNISLAEEVSSVRYFYICNAMTGYYLYRSGNNLSMKTSLEKTELETASDNGFKFYVIKRAAETYHAGYSIVPYGETSKYVNKNSGNAEANALAIATNENDYSRWNFVAKDEVLNDPVLPFATSGEGTSSYYQIQNGKMDSDNIPYYIIPPASIPGNAAASKSEEAATVKSGSWYFMKVQDPVLENSDPSQIDWLTYYKVVNAETGKVLYYSFTANNSPCIKVGDYVENDGNYMFAFVKSPTTDYYYIVPKTVKDNQLANISCFWRDGSNMKPATTRKKDNNIWTFTPATLFCNDPEFVEEEGVIKIKCNTNGAKIYINTESDDDPTSGSTLYDPTTQNWATTDRVRIKAIAVVSDGTNSASSSVFTLLNNPVITLGGTAPYIYNASPWEPGVTEVSIGEAPNKTSSTSGYSIAYSENHTDAGEVSVTVTDNVEDDLFIKNASTTFTIQRKGVTITASNASKPYDGEPLMKSGFTAGDLETGDTHTFTVAMTAESTITDAGTQPNVIATVDGVPVTTGTETVVGNYLVTTANGTLTVNPASVTLTANSRNTDVYDGTEKTVTGFTCKLGEQTVEGLTFEGVSASGSGTNAGDYDVTFTGVTVNETKDNTGNYVVIGTTVGTLTIKPASVTLTANSRNTDVYDGTEKTVTGFICKMGEQTVEGLTFAESVAASGSGTNAGEYDVTFTGVTLNETKDNTGNYVVTGTTNGTLTIIAKEITISGITVENKEYDGTTDAVLVYTGVTFTGKLDGETLTVTATGAFFDKNVGTGKIVKITGLTLGGTGAANYALAESGQQETATADITPASVTVTAENKTKGYGDDDPELTWTVDGLQGADTKDVLTVSMSRTEGEDVGTTITITPSGDTEQGNYTVSYVTGTLTITAKAIGDGTTPAEGIDIDITYDGTDYTVTVKQGENELQQGEDKAYTWTGADGSTDTYVVTITGQGNYNNSAKATYIKQTFYDTTPDQVLTTETTAAVYCATQNLKVNDTFEAYYVTKLENNSLTITKVEAGEGENKKNYIPEGQPVLLISETNPAPKGFTLKPYTGTGTDLVTIPETGEGANLLKVVTDDGGKAVNLEEVYIFSMGEFVLNKAGTMSKGKFYLENPDYNTSAHSRSVLSITSGDVTGINTFQLLDTDSQIPDIWYTIGGQKLHKKPTRKGIYLQNGKKVVIK